MKEILGEVVQGHIISGEIVGHGQVHVGCIELHVDLAVDGGLAVWVKVLAHPGRSSGVLGGGQQSSRGGDW